MRLAPKTWLLAVVAMILGILVAGGETTQRADPLPSLPSFVPDEVTRVTISTPVEMLRIERDADSNETLDNARWRIVTPLQFPADSAQVRSLLRGFSAGVPMEAYVDEGNLEDYVVDDQYGKLLEIWTKGDEPALSVVIGKTAAGGTTFVRPTGAQKVYRAEVGGRARFDRPAADWRDKMALDLDPAQVDTLVLTRGAEAWTFRRGPSTKSGPDGTPIPGAFLLDNAPFVIDTEAMEALTRGLVRLRAGEVRNPDFPGGFSPPAAVAALTLRDGSTHRITLGTATTAGAAYVKVDDRSEVFQVTGQLRRMLTAPLTALRDRSLFQFDRASLDSIALVDGGLTVVLSPSADGVNWSVTQPANMDADQRQVQFTVNTLANFRASDAAPDEAFTPSGTRFRLRFRDGHEETLDIGQAEGDESRQVRVRVSGRPGVYLLKQTTISELKKAFGRG